MFTEHVFPEVEQQCNRCNKGTMFLIHRPGLTHDLVKCDNDKCNYTYHSRTHKQKQHKLDGTFEYLDI